MEELFSNISATMVVIQPIIGLFNILVYVLTALGVYTLSRRRGIRKPWLAWIPVANLYALGCVSDQYQYVVQGRTKSRRVALVVLCILSVVFTMVFAGGIVFCVFLVAGMSTLSELQIVAILLLTLLPASVLGIWYTILQYMCLYDLYRSCKPENAVLFLVLTILLSVVTPFLIFACRNSDGGMPPRQAAQQPQPEL